MKGRLQTRALDSAIFNFDIELLSQLIRDAATSGHLREICDYLHVAMESAHSISSGVLRVAVVSAFEMHDFRGLDADPLEILSGLQDIEPQDTIDAARRAIMSALQFQVHRRNTFFLAVDRLHSSEAAVLVKDIINARRTELEELCHGSPTLEQLAATYYGFQFLTSQIRKSELGEDAQKLFECLELNTAQDVKVPSDVLRPEEVLFRNVSVQTDELLRNILYLTGYNSDERAKSAARLGELADPRAEPYLSQATRDEYSWVRKAAVSALGQIRFLEDPGCVVDVLKDFDEGTRNAALESVCSVGPRTVPLLLDILDNYRGVSYPEAIEAAKKSHPRALDNLEALLQYHSRTARALAANALGRIGGKRAISALERATQDEESEVRSAAQDALIEMKRL